VLMLSFYCFWFFFLCAYRTIPDADEESPSSPKSFNDDRPKEDPKVFSLQEEETILLKESEHRSLRFMQELSGG